MYRFCPEDESLRRIHPGDMPFKLLAVSTSMALDLLRCSPGHFGLVQLGQAMRTSAIGREIRAGDPAAWVQDFMARVPGTFPAIVVHDLGSTNGRTTRFEWNNPAGRSFVAEQAAIIEISSHVSTCPSEKLCYLS